MTKTKTKTKSSKAKKAAEGSGSDFAFRKAAVKQLPTKKGVYVLCDLDDVPLYVGQSKDGIRSRVARHLTSARSDIIANRQIDVWEIASVRAFPVESEKAINDLESALFHSLNAQSKLVNGSAPPIVEGVEIPEPFAIVRVISDSEVALRRHPAHRLPRQAGHYAQIVGHFLSVKSSIQIARAIDAHFERLSRYHRSLLRLAEDDDPESD